MNKLRARVVAKTYLAEERVKAIEPGYEDTFLSHQARLHLAVCRLALAVVGPPRMRP